jgi:hypothetical protein
MYIRTCLTVPRFSNLSAQNTYAVSLALDLLGIQRTMGNRQAQRAVSVTFQLQRSSAATGHTLIGVGAQTPVKSTGEYGDLIVKLLTADKTCRRSVQDIVREAAESQSIGLAAPTTAEAGKVLPQNRTARRTALVLTNTKYEKPSENLPKTTDDGRIMRAQLQTRQYRTNWLKNQTASQMIAAVNDVVIFYSGHGEMDGMQGVDNRFVSPQIVAGWKDLALAKGFTLTIIIEACHSASTADFIRKQEGSRIQEAGSSSGKANAVKLAKIAEQLQQIKDRLALLERSKQALMEEPMFSRLQMSGSLDETIKARANEIDAAWKKALPEIPGLAKQVRDAANEELVVPTFGREQEWLNIMHS